MKYRYFFLFVGLSVVTTGYGQSCEFEPSAKATKLLEKAADKKKYDSDQRIGFFEEALDEDANCLPCLLELGES